MDLAPPRVVAAPPDVARWLRRVLPSALLASLLASLPALAVGFASDDLTHRLMLEGKVPGYAGGWSGLYDFTPPAQPTSAMIEQGMFPWFTDPELSLRFLRPISSVTLALDHVLFGRNAFAAHVHTLLWMLALGGIAASLYKSWLAPRAALLAAVIFSVSGVHAIPVAWLASRHTLVAATFGALSLWAWYRHHAHGQPRHAALVVVALILSLLSSESGLVTITMLVGLESAFHGLRTGLARSALPLGIGVVYLLAYAALGYGARASTFYVSPFQAPGAYLVTALLGAPALSAELLLGVPSIAAGLGGTTSLLVLGVLGLAAAAGLFVLDRALGEEGLGRPLRGLALGAAAGLTALVGAPVSGRVLPLPALAAAAIMGQALSSVWDAARARRPATARPVRGRKRWYAAAAAIALFQLVLSPAMRLIMPPQMNAHGQQQEKIAREADVGACSGGGSLFLINGSDPTLTLYAASALLFYTPDKAHAEHFRVLSMAPQAQRLSRVAPDAVELEVLGPRSTSNPFEELFRGKGRPLPLHADLPAGDLAVRVEATEDNRFTRARFTIAGGIDPTQHCLLAWRDQRLENVPWPGPGERIDIAHQPGPLGL